MAWAANIGTVAAATISQREAAIDDLFHVPVHKKSEPVGGKTERLRPPQSKPGFAAATIPASPPELKESGAVGAPVGDSVGFIMKLPSRGPSARPQHGMRGLAPD